MSVVGRSYSSLRITDMADSRRVLSLAGPSAKRPSLRHAAPVNEATDASKTRQARQKKRPAASARVARLEKRVSVLSRELKYQRQSMKELWRELLRATDPHPE